MKKKLWQRAFLLSPIIALYGTWPMYMHDNVDLFKFLILFLSTTLIILILWSAHIYLTLKLPYLNTFSRFVLPYLLIVLIRLAIQNVIPFEQIPKLTVNSELIFNIFLSLVPNIIIMIICNSIASDYKRARAEKEIQELKFQNSEAQKQVLTQQLQPHFLFNALGVLKSLISTDQKKAEEYTIRLSHFLRYSIHSQKEDVVILEKELAFVNDYIALQKVRFGDAFIADIQIPADALNQRIPVFALQTLVENIFKHNYFTEKRPIAFSLRYHNNSITISNKKNPASHIESNQTGLANLNSRYLLIRNKQIEINETTENFTVTIPTIE